MRPPTRAFAARLALPAALVAVASTLAFAPSATAAPAQPVTASVQQADLLHGVTCTVNNGRAYSGRAIGGSPPRFEYDNSPYLGARYDSCGDSVKLYYGGYTGITHYNIRWGNTQREVGPGQARVLTLNASQFGEGDVDFVVQACKRGSGPFSTSSCTRWSPPVRLSVNVGSTTSY